MRDLKTILHTECGTDQWSSFADRFPLIHGHLLLLPFAGTSLSFVLPMPKSYQLFSAKASYSVSTKFATQLNLSETIVLFGGKEGQVVFNLKFDIFVSTTLCGHKKKM